MLNSISQKLNTPFHQNNITKTAPTGFAKLKKKRLLPHIQQQYSYRITNRLLIYKIMHPKRDKNITDSLINTSLTHSLTKLTHKSLNPSISKASLTSKPQIRHQKPLLSAQSRPPSASSAKDSSKHRVQRGKEGNSRIEIEGINDQENAQTKFSSYNKHREKRVGKILKNNFFNAQNNSLSVFSNSVNGQSGCWNVQDSRWSGQKTGKQKQRGELYKSRVDGKKERIETMLTETSNSKSILKRHPRIHINNKSTNFCADA